MRLHLQHASGHVEVQFLLPLDLNPHFARFETREQRRVARRYTDFTRTFLPREDFDKDRWARVMQEATGPTGLPPIEVYQIGDVYFVIDGNHRVSVVRQMGATHIQAYVTEVETRVPLSPDIQPDELILKAEYTNFLEVTRLDELRPGADLNMTVPGRYGTLLEHIEIHRYFMGLELQREISHEEAAWLIDPARPSRPAELDETLVARGYHGQVEVRRARG